MSSTEVILHGTVRPDGLIELDPPAVLPPGPVELKVRIQATEVANADSFLAFMEEIWADQRARGHVPRTKEEIDTEVNALRDEAEEEMQAIERLPDDQDRKADA